MSYSETITKADLTNILNKVLPIRSETPCDTVTLPFTPTANGLMIVLIRNTSSARAYQSFTNTLPTLVDNYAVADGYWSQIVYVQKGKQVALSTQSNIKSVTYYYIPLDDIVSASLRTSDYIVEQGTSGIWTYRKWNSGIAECWGEEYASVGANSVDNSHYVQFPFTFKVTPVVLVGLKAGGADLYDGWAEQGSTTASQVRLTLINRYSSSVTMYAQISVHGRWK